MRDRHNIREGEKKKKEKNQNSENLLHTDGVRESKKKERTKRHDSHLAAHDIRQKQDKTIPDIFTLNRKVALRHSVRGPP